jgi:predicted nucleic acid-binding protein
MKIIVAVDANILLSALLGGKPSIILFDGKYQFVTTKFTLEEVKKYLPRLERKLGFQRKNFYRF